MPDFVSADFDGNGADDLAIRGGGVRVYFADSDGLPIWPKYLDEFLMPGLNQGDDSQETTADVGNALAADDFEGRGSFDLAIGIPDYDIHSSTISGDHQRGRRRRLQKHPYRPTLRPNVGDADHPMVPLP
jgi:hypothetical protein